jgi:putative ABC transport system permease protein
MLAELRYAVRSLWRAPWYSATFVGVIALGVALATTVFAVVDGVLFKPLPYPDADRLVTIEPGFNNLPAPASPPASPIKRVMAASMRDVAGWQAAAPDAAITGFLASRRSGMGEGINENLFGVGLVQANFFDTVGVRPLLGGLAASDFDREDIVLPVVITYELWQVRFHGANDVIGQIYIGDATSGRGFRVAGVMPRGFVFPSAGAPVSFIAPYVPSPDVLGDPTRRTVGETIARLPRGMSVAALQARVEAATAAALPTRPRPAGYSDRGWRMQGPFDHADVLPLAGELGRTERPLFRAIFLAALVLLAIGGLNVSSLMAARGLDRARELSLRRALGGTGVRIARLIFFEALVPIAVGAVIGLSLAAFLLQAGLRLLPENLVLLTPQMAPSIDARAVMFVVLSAWLLAIPTTIWPIRRALRTGTAALKDGSGGATRTRSVGRSVVIVSQVAGALVLTMGGALLVTSVLAIYANTPAIRTDGVVVLRERMPGLGADGTIGSPDRTVRVRALIETLRRLPGVDGVALTEGQILDGGGGVPWWTPPPAAAMSNLAVVAEAVTSDFYRVLQPQLVTGRFPTDAELESGAPVIVVSEAVARAYWPNESPLGQTLNYFRVTVPFAVVGVVKDVRWNSWDTEVASIYGPYARVSRSSYPTVFIRTRQSTGQITAGATQAIAAADPLIRTTHAGTLDELFADSVRPRRLQSWLFGSFALVALVIVGVGILSLIAMATARRTREMGIRLALGATRDTLVGLPLREQLRDVVAGVIAGSLISVWAVRFVKVYLYQITPYDPRVWTAAVVAIVAAAALGTLIPSLRASRVDPVQALRAE